MAKLSDSSECVNIPKNNKLKRKFTKVADDNAEEALEQTDKVQNKHEDVKHIIQTKDEKVIENMRNKYNERRGRQLFVRFPIKLPADEEEFQQKARSLSNLVVAAHKPRQKHARFCLIDFNSSHDRDLTLKEIREASSENDENFKGIFVSIPRTESQEVVQELIDKKLKSLEMKRSKMCLKRESKKALSKNVTSSIVVYNLPKDASVADIRQLFPNAVDIHVKPNQRRNKFNGLCVALITLPSVEDARAALKESHTLGGKKLLCVAK